MAKTKLYTRNQMRRFRISRQKQARWLQANWAGKYRDDRDRPEWARTLPRVTDG